LDALNHPIIDLGHWLAQPGGRYIREWEQNLFDQVTADIFGYHAVQMGLPQINALAANRMPHQWLTNVTLVPASTTGEKSPVVLVHDFAELPFDSQSIDLVILPHVLEFVPEPHQVLREVERVLIPEGRVIICGFNRASLWGARQMAGRMTKSYFLPEKGEFISAPRMKDWLKLLNMEVKPADFGCYVPPYETEKWLRRFAFMENMGAKWWPYFGAVYMMQAIKRVKGMHLIGPVLKQQRVPRVSAIPVTNKMKEQNK
jgi:SAM-dependent methyltransferase